MILNHWNYFIDYIFTVWNFREFSVTLILREINFGETTYVEVLKRMFLILLGQLNFGIW